MPLLIAVKSRCSVCWTSAPLSTALTAIDILIKRLQQTYRIRVNALAWIRSFLYGRCQQVAYNGQLSALMELLFGVPQGSVRGPLQFLLHTAELFDVIARSGLVGYSYADYTQVPMPMGVVRIT